MGYHKSTFTRLFSRKPTVPLIEANRRQQAQDRENLRDKELDSRIKQDLNAQFPMFWWNT